MAVKSRKEFTLYSMKPNYWYLPLVRLCQHETMGTNLYSCKFLVWEQVAQLHTMSLSCSCDFYFTSLITASIFFFAIVANLSDYLIIYSFCRLVKGDDSERELAVRASAAAFYSTCNFLQSMESLPSF